MGPRGAIAMSDRRWNREVIPGLDLHAVCARARFRNSAGNFKSMPDSLFRRIPGPKRRRCDYEI
jgi:hypothetical protein